MNTFRCSQWEWKALTTGGHGTRDAYPAGLELWKTMEMSLQQVYLHRNIVGVLHCTNMNLGTAIRKTIREHKLEGQSIASCVSHCFVRPRIVEEIRIPAFILFCCTNLQYWIYNRSLFERRAYTEYMPDETLCSCHVSELRGTEDHKLDLSVRQNDTFCSPSRPGSFYINGTLTVNLDTLKVNPLILNNPFPFIIRCRRKMWLINSQERATAEEAVMRSSKNLPCLLAGLLESLVSTTKLWKTCQLSLWYLTTESVLLILTFDISRLSVPMATREQV